MRVEGMIDKADAELLHQHAQQSKLGIVEVGSYMGRSTLVLAHGSRTGQNVPVWAVDPHEPYEVQAAHTTHAFTAHHRNRFMQHIAEAGMGDVVRLISLPSVQAARCWDREIDLLFIDGKHDFASVRGDLASWYMYVAPGGHILLHDYDLPDVQAACADFARYNFAQFEQLSARIAAFHIHPNASHHLWSIECLSAS